MTINFAVIIGKYFNTHFLLKEKYFIQHKEALQKSTIFHFIS